MLIEDLLSDNTDLVIFVTDDGDKEVDHDDNHEEDTEEPNQPDKTDVEICYFTVLCSFL